MTSILRFYEKGFKDGKFSYKIKYEEGIPTGVYECFDNENVGSSGVKLLRPIVETSPWKWHPLFIRTDSIFEALDRKIPA